MTLPDDYTNTVADAQLNVELWDGPSISGTNTFFEAQHTGTQIFMFDILPNGQYCWRILNNQSGTFCTAVTFSVPWLSPPYRVPYSPK